MGNGAAAFPHLMNELYQGVLPVKHLAAGTEELSQIKQELAQFAPDQVIWDIDDRSLTPPWGDNISDYFVTSEGEDFLSVFAAALDKAQQRNASLKIQTI